MPRFNENVKTSVLVVDDYREMVVIVRRMLLEFGFMTIDEANDGSSALTKLRTTQYGLVISDLFMVPTDGLELLRTIRDDPELKAVPFIMLTASSDKEQIIAARSAGVTDYIVKPFTAATLRKKLTAVLGDF